MPDDSSSIQSDILMGFDKFASEVMTLKLRCLEMGKFCIGHYPMFIDSDKIERKFAKMAALTAIFFRQELLLEGWLIHLTNYAWLDTINVYSLDSMKAQLQRPWK